MNDIGISQLATIEFPVLERAILIDCLDQIQEIQMVTDQQVRRLFQMSQDSKLNKSQVAMKAGMHEQTALKIITGKL